MTFARLAAALAVAAALLAPAIGHATEPQMVDRHGPGTQWYQPTIGKKRVKVEQTADRVARKVRDAAAQIVAHPAGCPRTRFCGCGVSVRVFGRPVRDLYLAANWRRFPSAHAAAGMVAWRHGHVFYIEQSYGDGTVLAYDPNSGRHLTRVHRRSLAGYRVVDPRGQRVAMAAPR